MKRIHSILLLSLLLTACASESTLKPFTNDGCSLFPDGNFKDNDLWCECCVIHDVAYWQGGSDEQRLTADKGLKTCVLKKTGNPPFADLMYKGVRLGGSSIFPTGYRWGYGWDYGVGDKALTTAQQAQVDKALKQLEAEPERLECPE